MLFIWFLAAAAACSGGSSVMKSDPVILGGSASNTNPTGVIGLEYKRPYNYNVKLVIKDSSISNPNDDRRCFYKIYVNKVEAGRSTIGLESQEKHIEFKLENNRHLIKVEKYVLNEKKGSYEKVNNIDQPKPDFIYFDTESDKILNIELNHKSASGNSGEFSLSFEKK